MKNIISDGKIINYTNSTGSKINSGDVVVLGKFCGVAVTDIANGATGAVSVEGVFDIEKKTSSDTMAVGDHVSYNSGVVKTGTAGVTIGKDVIVGYCVKASTGTDKTVRVKLG